MKAPRIPHAMIAVVALALAATMLAAPADADRDRGRGRGHSKHRYKHVEKVVVVQRPQHVVYVRPRVAPVHVSPSYASLAFAGVIGGVQVSARFGDAPYHGYGYWDPYCDVGFTSLRAYRHHCGAHGHAYRLKVFAVPPGHDHVAYRGNGCDDDDHGWDD
jgi:hypothetical protein